MVISGSSQTKGEEMEIHISKRIDLNHRDFSNVSKAILNFEQVLSAFSYGKGVPDDSVLRIEMESFGYQGRSVFSVRFLVRFVCPGVGSFASRIYLSDAINDPHDPIFFLDGKTKRVGPDQVFEAVFGQALQKLLSSKVTV